MAFSEVFNDDLSVSVGNPTKATEYNNLANNTDAVKERYVVGHHFNNTGVTNEDGFHRGDFSDPFWIMAKDTGNSTTMYGALWIDLSNSTSPTLRFKLGGSTAAPVNATGGTNIVPDHTEDGFTDTSLL